MCEDLILIRLQVKQGAKRQEYTLPRSDIRWIYQLRAVFNITNVASSNQVNVEMYSIERWSDKYCMLLVVGLWYVQIQIWHISLPKVHPCIYIDMHMQSMHMSRLLLVANCYTQRQEHYTKQTMYNTHVQNTHKTNNVQHTCTKYTQNNVQHTCTKYTQNKQCTTHKYKIN